MQNDEPQRDSNNPPADRNQSSCCVIVRRPMHTPGAIGQEGEPMTDLRATEIAIVADDEDGARDSAVSWAAVAAGAVVAAALTLLLMAFGAGTGLSSISPWSNSGVSATTFSVGAGIYLVVAAMLSSTIGGYLAGRLRTRWLGVHSDEVYFRDTAHGFIAWAFASVLGAVLLASPASSLIRGAASGATQATASAASQAGPMDGTSMLCCGPIPPRHK